LSGIPALLTRADTDLEASDNNYLCLKAQFQPGPVFFDWHAVPKSSCTAPSPKDESKALAGWCEGVPKGEGFGMVLSHAREGSVRPDLFSFSLKLARKGILGYRWDKDSP
jgi:hypothetical protein